MTPDQWDLLKVIIPSILASRIWSMFEHLSNKKEVRKNDEDIKDIKIYINGDTKKRIEEAKKAGIEEGIKIEQNRNRDLK